MSKSYSEIMRELMNVSRGAPSVTEQNVDGNVFKRFLEWATPQKAEAEVDEDDSRQK